MRYISTRGASPPVGFVDAILAGLAPDGGLYVPESWPQFSAGEIAGMAGQPYAEVAAAVLGRFAGDEIPEADLLAMCRQAYAAFDHPAVVPLVQLGPDVFLAELFHGPSLAFKDVAMQLLARLSDFVLERAGRTQTILCATSGDTGGAAVEAFRGRSNTRIVAMFPEGRISEVQRRFMTTATEDNVRCLAVAGDFDTCQAILKTALGDPVLQQAVGLSAVNSINFARIVAQSVYYFTTALALGAPHRPVSFAVPSGNFGDGFAGYVAYRMGLPIGRILIATNANDILARTFRTGQYARGTVAETQSPAMDIQSASNFERLFFETVGRDGPATAEAFRGFAEGRSISVPPQALEAMTRLFAGETTDEAATSEAMRLALSETGETVDPHTAVALSALRRSPGAGPTVVLATAHPAKFPDAVLAATGHAPLAPERAQALAGRPERCESIVADVALISAYVRDFAGA
ncbi:MAG: threonine synthase [Phenylobacterium sp.]